MRPQFVLLSYAGPLLAFRWNHYNSQEQFGERTG